MLPKEEEAVAPSSARGVEAYHQVVDHQRPPSSVEIICSTTGDTTNYCSETHRGITSISSTTTSPPSSTTDKKELNLAQPRFTSINDLIHVLVVYDAQSGRSNVKANRTEALAEYLAKLLQERKNPKEELAAACRFFLGSLRRGDAAAVERKQLVCCALERAFGVERKEARGFVNAAVPKPFGTEHFGNYTTSTEELNSLSAEINSATSKKFPSPAPRETQVLLQNDLFNTSQEVRDFGEEWERLFLHGLFLPRGRKTGRRKTTAQAGVEERKTSTSSSSTPAPPSEERTTSEEVSHDCDEEIKLSSLQSLEDLQADFVQAADDAARGGEAVDPERAEKAARLLRGLMCVDYSNYQTDNSYQTSTSRSATCRSSDYLVLRVKYACELLQGRRLVPEVTLWAALVRACCDLRARRNQNLKGAESSRTKEKPPVVPPVLRRQVNAAVMAAYKARPGAVPEIVDALLEFAGSSENRSASQSSSSENHRELLREGQEVPVDSSISSEEEGRATTSRRSTAEEFSKEEHNRAAARLVETLGTASVKIGDFVAPMLAKPASADGFVEKLVARREADDARIISPFSPSEERRGENINYTRARWTAEHKYDGERLQVHYSPKFPGIFRCFARSGKTSKFQRILEGPLKREMEVRGIDQDLILDCEVVQVGGNGTRDIPPSPDESFSFLPFNKLMKGKARSTTGSLISVARAVVDEDSEGTESKRDHLAESESMTSAGHTIEKLHEPLDAPKTNSSAADCTDLECSDVVDDESSQADTTIPDAARNLRVMAFDLLLLDGAVLLSASFAERRQLLRNLLLQKKSNSASGENNINDSSGKNQILQLAAGEDFLENYATEKAARKDLRRHLRKAVAARCEGLLLKDMGGTYEPGSRSGAWRKLKKDFVEREEFFGEVDGGNFGGNYNFGGRHLDHHCEGGKNEVGRKNTLLGKNISDDSNKADDPVSLNIRGSRRNITEISTESREKTPEARRQAENNSMTSEVLDCLDLIPVGAWYGKGQRQAGYGSFLMAVYNEENDRFETICKVGTGFSQDLLDELFERWLPTDQVLLCEDEEQLLSDADADVDGVGTSSSKDRGISYGNNFRRKPLQTVARRTAMKPDVLFDLSDRAQLEVYSSF